MGSRQAIGLRLPMIDSEIKVRGEARFAADIRLPDMAVAKLLASPHAHAEILAIDTADAEAIPGVYGIITAADIPEVEGYDPADRSHGFMARRFATYVGQPVAAVAAEDEATAEKALAAIRVTFKVLFAVLDWEEAIAPEAVSVSHDHHRDDEAREEPPAKASANDAGNVELQNGDLEAAFADADLVHEETYRIPRLYQGYLEPHAVCAHWDRHDHVDVWACVQSPFGSRNMVMDTLGLPAGSISMHVTDVGGAFGAKDLGLFCPIAVLLARKARRPIKLALSRSEDMATANPSPEVHVCLKVGAKADGTLTGIEGTVHVAIGAFRTYWGPASLSVCGLLINKYRFGAFHLKAYDVFTNHVSFGAYRAPMALQAAFAIESHLDEMAGRLGMDPIGFREKNLIREGDLSASGMTIPAHGGPEVLEALRRHPIWAEPALPSGDGLLRGRGMALGLWGSGAFPASAIAKLEKGGLIRIIIGQVDLTGSYTALAQIAADTLGVDPGCIIFGKADTSRAPHASVSGGSSTIYSMGKAVREAVKDLRDMILARGAKELDTVAEDVGLDTDGVYVLASPDRRCSLASLYDLESDLFASTYEPFVGRGASGGDRLRLSAPCFAGTLVQVAVEPETGRVTVERAVTAQDVGRAINPMSVEGQLQGAAVQALGAGLWEGLDHGSDGQLLNGNFLDYRMPTSADVPSIETILIEQNAGDGPFGAKGVGEPPVIPPAAAVANAIRDALGTRITDMPITPERIWRATADASEEFAGDGPLAMGRGR